MIPNQVSGHTFFQQNKNLIIILAAGMVAFIMVFAYTGKVKSHQPQIDDTRYKEQLEMYKEALNRSKRDPYKLVTNGVNQINSKSYEMATITLEQAVKQDKEYRDAWLYLGLAYLKTGASSNAIKSLESAKSKDPLYLLTYKYLCSAYIQANDSTQANACNEKLNALKQ